MKLFKISQNTNNDYDTYDSAVVCCKTEEEARNTNPHSGMPMTENDWEKPFSNWCNSPDQVTVEHIGKADKSVCPGIVCASYNAG